MNERITQLALRAEDYAFDESKKLESSVETVFSNRVFFKSFKEKFAELIVNECCDVLQSETIRHDGYGYNQGFLHKKIKEHFGVEE